MDDSGIAFTSRTQMKSENRDSQREKNLAMYSISVTFVDKTPVNDSASLQPTTEYGNADVPITTGQQVAPW